MQDPTGSVMRPRQEEPGRDGGEVTHSRMDEGRARALAGRIAGTPGYGIEDVRRAWSTAWAWQVEVIDARTGARLLLLAEDEWDDHRAGSAHVIAH